MTSCGGDGKPEMAVDEVKRHYIALFKKGTAFGDAGMIKARDYDRSTLDLVDVTIEDDGLLVHADRVQLIVDHERDTIALRLIGVTKADAEKGSLFEVPISEPTGAIALEFDAVP